MEEHRSKETPSQALSRRKSNSTRIALSGVLAGIYAVTTFALGTISYGVLNLRFSNVLLGVVPFLGWPGVIGMTFGVFLSNLGSPIYYDYISFIFSFAGLVALHVLRRRSVLAGLGIYASIISLWVSLELSLFFRLDYLPTLYAVFAGNILVDVVLAYVVYKALLRSGLRRRLESVNN